jgi:hypothetical protein
VARGLGGLLVTISAAVAGPGEWVELPDDPEEMVAEAARLGWGDGLPFIPATAERIEAMLAGAGVDAGERLPVIQPSRAEITAADVAVNAVMAGCRPVVFPVVLAAMRALVDPDFNLELLQSTTHPTAPLVIVHGEIAERAGFNTGTGTLGPGTVANATVGRAIRLCLLNLGHARPGVADFATQASPAKYGYCMAENAAGSPWAPYHADTAGLDPGQSAVTVMGAEGPHHVNDHTSTTATGVLSTVASMITVLGSNPTWITGSQTIVVLGPEHAATVAQSGFTRRDVQMWLYENARMPLSAYKRGGMWGMQIWPRWKQVVEDDGFLMCPLDSPDSFRVIVGGGTGRNSCVIPGDGLTPCVTVAIN